MNTAERRRSAALIGIVATLGAAAAAGYASADDARLSMCQLYNPKNVAVAQIDLDAADHIWRLLPAMGISPELSEDSRPAFAAVFADPYFAPAIGSHGVVQSQLSGVVCIVNADGQRIIYTNVPRAGFSQ
jgi:hypothetical protein